MIKHAGIKIIGFPIFVLRRIRNWFIYLFRNLHLSMRRRITVDYLTIYIITCLISLFFVPLTFLLFEIGDNGEDLSKTLDPYILSYARGSFDYNDLEIKVNQIANSEEIALKISLDELHGDNGNTLTIQSEYLSENVFPQNIGEYAIEVFKNQLVAKRLDSYIITSSESGRELNVDIVGLFPMAHFSQNLFTLIAILLVFYSIGFVFMSMIGGARVKNILSPIFFMTKTAEQISISNLDLRLDVETTKYELKDLAITLNEMLDRLDKDYSKQKRFVSDVSHELRTPISIVNGYASMLERWGKKDDEILEESIEAIKSEAINMQHLVENLLTLVRSDNQTLKYEASYFDIGEMICGIVKEFNMVNTKDQYITCDSKPGINVFLDQAKIKQTIRIFVDNAIKYSPHMGSIQIKCYQIEEEVFIHIKDSGIGISKDDLQHLFERFYRSDESRTRETGGHGLGLSIAKVMIIGHKGRIKVKSRLGKGSEFIISLPSHLS